MRKSFSLIFLAALGLSGVATATQGYSGTASFFDGSSHSLLLFVSPHGNDINGNGSREYPWKSPQKAIDYVDDNLVSGGAMVVALDGTYYLPDGLDFGDTDYSARGGLVFRAENPGGAVLSGGVYLNGDGEALENNSADNRIHADYRDHVRKWDAGAAVPFGHNITMSGWNFNTHQERAELFYDGEPMRLARFPNPGPHDPVNNRYTGNLTILERLASTSAVVDLRGMKTPDNTPGLLLRGTVSKVKYSDAQELVTVLTGTGTQNGVVSYSPHNTGRGRQFEYPPYDENDPDQPEFYLCNSIYEIDEPGEYFIDDTNSTLYFYPPHNGGQLMLSKSEEPVVEMNQTKGLSLGFFVIEGSRDSAVTMQDAEDVQLVGNLIRNVGRYGIYMQNGWRNTVRSNRITATGENAMVITGGDRTDLKPSGHLITNNELYRWARVQRMWRQGIMLYTQHNGGELKPVGVTISHNTIYDHAGGGIYIRGNNHLIEGNRMFRLLTESNDTGAIDSQSHPTEAGVVLRENYIHDIYKLVRGYNLVMAMYLDIIPTLYTVDSNVMERCSVGVSWKGRWGTVTNNLFEDCWVAFTGHDRGAGKDAKRTNVMFYESHFRSPAWRQNYPQIVNTPELLDRSVDVPSLGNLIGHNVFLNCGENEELHPQYPGDAWHGGIIRTWGSEDWSADEVEFRDNLYTDDERDAKPWDEIKERAGVDETDAYWWFGPAGQQ